MAQVTLVTGPCRSGKSSWAQRYAESLGLEKTFVATCPVSDDEMDERIRRHRSEREGKGWLTEESPLELKAKLDSLKTSTVLIDCLTLWASNLMFQAEESGLKFGENQVQPLANNLLLNLPTHLKHLILVTNEVGWGIVPENAMARQFRDIAGRMNQTIAEKSDRVILCVCGIPTAIKGNLPHFITER